MRVAFVLRESEPDAPSVSPVITEVTARVRQRGARVTFVIPEQDVLDLATVRVDHDLYVLVSKSPMALALAGTLASAGASIVNSFESCVLTRDKIAATALLAAAGVPVPPSWATGRGACVRSLLEEGPLWLKPQRGSRGMGVRRLASGRELDEPGTRTDAHGFPVPLFAQREVPSDGRDVKVYVVGERVWAISRPFPARTIEDKMGMPVQLSPALRDAALVCGRTLGLALYGVDFLVSGERFFAVDVNAFPGFKGIPEAPRRLAEHIGQHVRTIASARGRPSVRVGAP